jgi:hypothetical protein
MVPFLALLYFVFDLISLSCGANLRSTGLPAKNAVYEYDGHLFQFVQDPWHPRKENALALLVASPSPSWLSNTSHICETFRVNKFEGQNRIMLDSGQVFDIEMHRRRGYYVLRNDVYSFLNLTASEQVPQCIVPTAPSSATFPVEYASSFVPAPTGEYVIEHFVGGSDDMDDRGILQHLHYDARNGSLLYTVTNPGSYEAPSRSDDSSREQYLGWDGDQHWWYKIQFHDDNAYDDSDREYTAIITSQSGETVAIANFRPTAVSESKFVVENEYGSTVLFSKEGALLGALPVVRDRSYYPNIAITFLSRDGEWAFSVAQMYRYKHPLSTMDTRGYQRPFKAQPIIITWNAATGSVVELRALPYGWNTDFFVHGGYVLDTEEFVLVTSVSGMMGKVSSATSVRRYRW